MTSTVAQLLTETEVAFLFFFSVETEWPFNILLANLVHSLYVASVICLSVVCLSVTLVHPTQVIEVFSNVSMP